MADFVLSSYRLVNLYMVLNTVTYLEALLHHAVLWQYFVGPLMFQNRLQCLVFMNGT